MVEVSSSNESEQQLYSAFGWRFDEKRGVHVSPPIKITVSSANVSAGQLGDLLWALEELWAACAGDDKSARLELVDLGTGSFWARVKAECKNAPIATFAAFVAIVTAIPSDSPSSDIPKTEACEQAATVWAFTKKGIEDQGGNLVVSIELSSEEPSPASLKEEEAEAQGPALHVLRIARLNREARRSGRKFRLGRKPGT